MSITLRILIGGVFVTAGAIKATDPAGLADAMSALWPGPHALNVLLSLYLPWLEIFSGLAVIFGRRWVHAAGLGIIAVLLATFTAVLGTAWWRSLDVSCGCFGDVLPWPLSWLIIRNVVLLLLIFAVGRIPGKALRNQSHPVPPTSAESTAGRATPTAG